MNFKVPFISAAFFAFVAFTSLQLEANTNADSNLSVSAVIGDSEFVILSRYNITGTVDTSIIGTTGTDALNLGAIEVNIYSSAATQSNNNDKLSLFEYEYDTSNTNYSLLHQANKSDRLFLEIRSTITTAGVARAPTTIGNANNAILRAGMSTNAVVDEVFEVSFWLRDNANNASTAGRYAGMFVFFFTD